MQQGGDLAEFDNLSTLNLLFTVCTTRNCWLGGNDIASEGYVVPNDFAAAACKPHAACCTYPPPLFPEISSGLQMAVR